MVGGRLGTVGEATIPVSDEGLLRGDGAFELVRVYAGRPFALPQHLDRLERTCATIRLSCDRRRLERDIQRSSRPWRPRASTCGSCSPEGGQRLVLAEPMPELPERLRLALVVDTPRRVLGGAKTLSYAGNMLARRLAVERGFDEALLVSPEGRVLELQTASFFYVDTDGVLCTPPSDRRDPRFDHAACPVRAPADRGAPLHAREHVLACREAFAASAAREVQPVGAIEDRVFDDDAGPLTRAAQDAFWAEVELTTGVARPGRSTGVARPG